MGGKKEKLLLEKAERVDEPFQIHHKKCLVLHLMSRSMVDLIFVLLAQYKNGSMSYLRLHPCKQIEQFLYATAGFPRERLP